MSAAEQKETFQTALSEALGDACSMDVIQAVHEQLAAKIEEHKQSKDPEPLDVYKRQPYIRLPPASTQKMKRSVCMSGC